MKFIAVAGCFFVLSQQLFVPVFYQCRKKATKTTRTQERDREKRNREEEEEKVERTLKKENGSHH